MKAISLSRPKHLRIKSDQKESPFYKLFYLALFSEKAAAGGSM